MPPNLDIYVLTRRRDRGTIDRFLDTHVDRVASDVRPGAELCVLAFNAPPGAEDHLDPVEWVPISTMADVVELGLATPGRAFAHYMAPRDPAFAKAYIAFTRDDRLVLGVSIDDWNMDPRKQHEAERILNRLMSEFDGDHGLVTVEEPPPLSEESFMATGRRIVTARSVRSPT